MEVEGTARTGHGRSHIDDRVGHDRRIVGIGGSQHDHLALEIDAGRGEHRVRPLADDDLRAARARRHDGIFNRRIVLGHQEVVDDVPLELDGDEPVARVHGHGVGVLVPGGASVGADPLPHAVAGVRMGDQGHDLELVVRAAGRLDRAVADHRDGERVAARAGVVEAHIDPVLVADAVGSGRVLVQAEDRGGGVSRIHGRTVLALAGRRLAEEVRLHEQRVEVEVAVEPVERSSRQDEDAGLATLDVAVAHVQSGRPLHVDGIALVADGDLVAPLAAVAPDNAVEQRRVALVGTEQTAAVAAFRQVRIGGRVLHDGAVHDRRGREPVGGDAAAADLRGVVLHEAVLQRREVRVTAEEDAAAGALHEVAGDNAVFDQRAR